MERHPGTELVIDVSGLARRFESGRRRRRRVVDALGSVDLAVAAGERVAFIGPNGAGKSTCIKILTGVLTPSAGRVRVLGLEPWRQRRELARRIGVLFGQRSQLWQELPARESLALLASVHGLDRANGARRIGDLAERLDATDLLDAPFRTLSLGQRMRCELLAALLHRPELLFLDEPTIGLDVVSKQRFRDLLVSLNADDGITVFLTSHDVADIEHVADRAVVLAGGSIVFDDEVTVMRRGLLSRKRIEVSFADAVTAERLDAALRPAIMRPATVMSLSPSLLRVDLDTADGSLQSALDAVLGVGGVVDLSVLDPPLDTVIESIFETNR